MDFLYKHFSKYDVDQSVMQAIKKLKKIDTGYKGLFLLLGVLLIFYSCDTRKAVQAGFSLPVSKTLNPIKSAVVDSAHCLDYEEEAFQKDSYKQPSKTILVKGCEEFANALAENISLSYRLTNKTLASPIPIYILFRQLKAFI